MTPVSLQLRNVWVFAYAEPPLHEMHALTGGRATVVDGCLEMCGDASFAELSEKMNRGLVEIAKIKKAG